MIRELTRVNMRARLMQDGGSVNDPRIRAIRKAVGRAFVQALNQSQLHGIYETETGVVDASGRWCARDYDY